ncbi:carboxyl-terminal-processing peptidase 2, chloroplastic-like isoform X1 [Camellia sinensis]|uniref:carboxyl-terminal-processing peptidase 2, chloroplastic-like isoform X1 n=1 Tax=Camellia sinensis TaxID=4442 RepID=UPI0010367E6C|nr:carboxyl-terminal-processing peptidase 2, chloroplastic-like isoform X1 [Camellia sinensis]
MCLSVEMMVVIGGSVTASSSLSPPFLISNAHINLNFSPKVRLQNSLPFGIMKTQLRNSLSYISKDFSDRPRSCELVFYSVGDYRPRFFCQPAQRHGKKITSQCGLFSVRFGHLPKLRKYTISLQKAIKCSKFFKKDTSILFVRLLVGMVLVMTISFAVFKTPSWALTEENLIFLEAWRTIDRAYVDKTFNGQSWFRYRENALLNEPMKSREETYMAIRKMLATLDDPFTRFLEPEKFKSLRSGTQGALTGVGLSIGYPTGGDGLRAGLVVISAAPGSPANKAGILSGDVILKIDDTSTETMGIYDAAERLQGTKGSAVELTIRSGPEIKQLSLKREKVSLNPVQSRLCEIPALGKDASRVGYIKLASFNQNASGAVREAIETLRRNNVNAFVLDLRDNSGGLFPEGIEIAKIWLEKGVIVYISDSQGVRDIYDTDGSNAIAAVEPLAVLVNKGTASASEILAGALKDNKRAMVFGEPTYGKGKIQSVFELSDGSGLAVTVAQYETPAHTDINKTILYQHLFQRMIRAFVDASRTLILLAISTESSYFHNDKELFMNL